MSPTRAAPESSTRDCAPARSSAFSSPIARHRLFFNGGAHVRRSRKSSLGPGASERNRPAAMYQERIREIWDAVVLESARWGDARRPNLPYTRGSEFQRELNFLMNNYFPNRSNTVLNQLRGIRLYPRVVAPTFSRHGGFVEPGL